ncbi:MAG: hypothetical protein AB7O13_24735 [Alphaproteobacteria bacterium]
MRGMLNLDDTTLYVVTGTRLNRVTTAGAATDMIEITGTDIAYLAHNRRQSAVDIGIVTAGGVFKIIRSNADVTPDLSSTHPVAAFNSICTLDGYAVVTATTGEFFISPLDDWASAWDEVAFVQTYLDLQRGIVRGADLMLAGKRATTFWQNTGATDFPFERTTTTNVGCYAPGSMVNLLSRNALETVIWIATNADGDLIGVMMLDGYQPVKISPAKLDRVIAAEAAPASIRATSYTASGHVFYTLSGTDWTWEYNASTGFWHERTSDGLDRWQIADSQTFAGKTILGHYASAALYQASDSIVPASASEITLRHSDDLGQTWTAGRTKSIGGSGVRPRARFNRLGQCKEDGRVFELSISNAVLEAGTGNPMTIVTPTVHAYPGRLRFYALYANITKGVSETAESKGALALAVNVGALAA